MTCSLCGRRLKNERSQKIGYGPVCYRRMFGSPPKRQSIKNRDSGGEDIPGQIGIEEYLKSLRDEG